MSTNLLGAEHGCFAVLNAGGPKGLQCGAVPGHGLHFHACHRIFIFISHLMKSRGKAEKWEERMGLLKAGSSVI